MQGLEMLEGCFIQKVEWAPTSQGECRYLVTTDKGTFEVLSTAWDIYTSIKVKSL